MVKHVKGNLLDSNCDYICHQVNCQGIMGSGIAKQIRERWPNVYMEYYDRCISHGLLSLMGSIDIVETPDGNRVINMYAQDNYGYYDRRYTSYDAFDKALRKIKREVPSGSTIGFPKNIGCGLGGGNWMVISTLIYDVLGNDYDVYIYEFDPEEGT